MKSLRLANVLAIQKNQKYVTIESKEFEGGEKMLSVAIAGFVGVLVGALLMIISFNLYIKYTNRQANKKRVLEHKMKEIEALNQLNKKVNEILQKRNILMDDFVSFDSFDDCYITIDDFVYIQSFVSQNNFYLPNYLVEEFFKNIAQRKVILSPEETTKIGGYTYKGGRIILEKFADEILSVLNEKKIQIKKMNNNQLTLFSSEEYY